MATTHGSGTTRRWHCHWSFERPVVSSIRPGSCHQESDNQNNNHHSNDLPFTTSKIYSMSEGPSSTQPEHYHRSLSTSRPTIGKNRTINTEQYLSNPSQDIFSDFTTHEINDAANWFCISWVNRHIQVRVHLWLR
mmetsp:Transcript_11538/g.31962  ORF Transcript_11538/g.31962 Transcript_11538/m.31962 type:complete len:135 (+) Transcript_11538:40-444(+)